MVRNRSQRCGFYEVQMNMLKQRMHSKLHHKSRLQRVTGFLFAIWTKTKSDDTLPEQGSDMQPTSQNRETALLYAAGKGSKSAASRVFSSRVGQMFTLEMGQGTQSCTKLETLGFIVCSIPTSSNFWQEDNSQENNFKQTPLHLAAKRMNNGQ